VIIIRLVSDVTQVLDRVQQGEAKASEELLPLVYEELRKVAAQKMANEPAGQTLQPTALVHEAWLRLVEGGQQWDGRGHFFAAAAEAMRRILVENARRKRALRHGGGQERVNICDVDVSQSDSDDELLAVHDALDEFARRDPATAQLVKLRYFAGLSMREAAEVLGQSLRTTERLWSYARAWLRREMLTPRP
jgi:RNA polymerase sigma factor (TIGR02999 family)